MKRFNLNSALMGLMATRSSRFAGRLACMTACITACVGMLLATLGTASAAPAGFKQANLHPAFQEKATMTRMLTAARQFAYTKDVSKFEDLTYARAYYRFYVPAKITRYESLGEAAGLIEDVRKRLKRATSQKTPAQPYMLKWVYEGVKPVAEQNYHPAARVNAILLLSHLETQAADFAAKKPPVIYAEVPSVLLPIYLSKANPEGVRAAALKGLRRYVKWNADALSSEHRSQLLTEMDALLTSDSPEYRDPLAHAYLQRFAIDILVRLRKGPNQDLVQDLIAISTDKTQPDLIATFAASRLASFEKTSLAGSGDADAIVANWTIRAALALEREAARVNSLGKLTLAKHQPPSPETAARLNSDKDSQNTSKSMSDQSMEMGAMGGPGDVMNDQDADGPMDSGPQFDTFAGAARAQPLEVTSSRRLVNHMLQHLHLGATGSRTAVTETSGGLMISSPAAKEKLAAWSESLGDTFKVLNSASLDTTQKYTKALLLQAKELRSLAAKHRGKDVNKNEKPESDESDSAIIEELINDSPLG